MLRSNYELLVHILEESSRYDNEPPGLNGDVLSLVRWPQGWICIGVHYASFFVFYMWGLSVSKSATELMHKEEEDNGNISEVNAASPTSERSRTGEVVQIEN